VPTDERPWWRRWPWVLAVAVVTIITVALGLAALFRGGSSSHQGKTLRGAVLKTDHTWRCRGRVDLRLVRVAIHRGAKGDAVHLDRGCTGVIDRLEIVGNGGDLGPSGDGVKIHAGAHDLRILAGFINCGKKSEHGHQDAIQAMGGKRVTFLWIESHGCANSFMFINSGRRRREKPEDVVCEYCRAMTNNFSVSVRNSVRSGALGGHFVSRVAPSATATATAPVLEHNGWRQSGVSSG
jgi:hypothetical protein